MANSTLSSLTEATALTDADELFVNDGGTSKRITAANARLGLGGPPVSSNATTRLDASTMGYPLASGPIEDFDVQTTAGNGGPGVYSLTPAWIRGGTVNEMIIDVMSVGTSGSMYVVVYNMDAVGMPTTLAYSFGTFNIATSTAQTLTGLTDDVAGGWYLYGTFHPTANVGTPTYEGGRYGGMQTIPIYQNTRNGFPTLLSGDTAHATPQDLSTFNLGTSATSTTFVHSNASNIFALVRDT